MSTSNLGDIYRKQYSCAAGANGVWYVTMTETISQYLSRIGTRGAAATNGSLSPEDRQKNARKAARVRWKKSKKRKSK
jgi:hypothetical protein